MVFTEWAKQRNICYSVKSKCRRNKEFVHVSSLRRRIKSRHDDRTKFLKCVNAWENSNILERQEEIKTACAKQLRGDLSSDNQLSSSLLFTVLSLVSFFVSYSIFFLHTHCRCSGLLLHWITLSDTPHSVSLLGTSDYSEERNST